MEPLTDAQVLEVMKVNMDLIEITRTQLCRIVNDPHQTGFHPSIIQHFANALRSFDQAHDHIAQLFDLRNRNNK